jgi:hypothetical protein
MGGDQLEILLYRRRSAPTASRGVFHPPADFTTEGEELETDSLHGMIATTAGSRTIDHDAGPLARYWSRRSSDKLESISTSKDMTCRG